jgi:hypothetical protein
VSAVVVASSNTVYYIGSGTDYAIYTRTSGTGWTRLNSQPPHGCTYTPGAFVIGATLYVECRGADGYVWYTTGALSPPALPSVGTWQWGQGSPINGLAVANVAGVITSFLVAGDNQVYAAPFGSASYYPMGIHAIGHPAASSNGAVAVLAITNYSDHQPMYTVDTGGGWSSMVSLGGSTPAGPGVTVAGTGQPSFWIEGNDGLVYVGHSPWLGSGFGWWAGTGMGSDHGGAAAATFLTNS